MRIERSLQGLRVSVYQYTRRGYKRSWYWRCKAFRRHGHGPFPTRQAAIKDAAGVLCIRARGQ